MSRREDIDNAIWSDPDFEALTLEATVLYLWSFTNPRCGMAGLYKVSKRAMTECKVPLERLDDAVRELAQGDYLYYDESVLWVRSRVKHIRSRTRQIAKSIANDVRKIPIEHPLRRGFLGTYGTSDWLESDLADLVAEEKPRLAATSATRGPLSILRGNR